MCSQVPIVHPCSTSTPIPSHPRPLHSSLINQKRLAKPFPTPRNAFEPSTQIQLFHPTISNKQHRAHRGHHQNKHQRRHRPATSSKIIRHARIITSNVGDPPIVIPFLNRFYPIASIEPNRSGHGTIKSHSRGTAPHEIEAEIIAGQDFFIWSWDDLLIDQGIARSIDRHGCICIGYCCWV